MNTERAYQHVQHKFDGKPCQIYCNGKVLRKFPSMCATVR